MVNNLPAIQETQVRSLDQEDPLEKEMEPTSVFLPGEFHGQWYCFAYKGPCSQSYDFSSSHLWMWTLDYKKAECLRIDAVELWCWRRLLRVPWTARRSNHSNLKEICSGCSLYEKMLKLKLQYFGHLMQSWLIGKVSDARRDWRQEEKRMTEDEVAGQHHWLDEHEFEWALGVDAGHQQGGLVCCNS